MKHCEDACFLGHRGGPVAIRWLKRYVADSVGSFEDAVQAKPGSSTGKKVAVIGAGASGLTVASFLRLQGHAITVFDSLPAAEGVLPIRPPRYRLPKEALDRDTNYIASLGVEFRLNTTVGEDIQFEDIVRDYDAIFIGIGTSVSASIPMDNTDKSMLALDFLRRTGTGSAPEVGREVIVIGSGNVAMDVSRSCVRLQQMQYPNEKTTTKIVCLESWEETPASDEEIEEALEEGIDFNPAWGPDGIAVEDDQVTGLHCKAVKSVFDEESRFSPTFDEENTMFLEGDMVIQAIGQRYDLSFIPEDQMDRLEFTERRKVKVDENGMTSIEGVFAGGDIVNLNLDAVTAIADAKTAAEDIDRFLSEP